MLAHLLIKETEPPFGGPKPETTEPDPKTPNQSLLNDPTAFAAGAEPTRIGTSLTGAAREIGRARHYVISSRPLISKRVNIGITYLRYAILITMNDQ